MLALGGDGTFLRAAELARPAKAPLLGINLGKVGFLAEAETDDLDEAVKDVVDGTYKVDERLTLDVRAEYDGRLIAESWALNEVSVEKGAARPDARAARRRRRAAAVPVRLRRRGLRDPDRLHGVRVLGRRPGGLARGRGAAAGADQRPRAVQPAAGDRADVDASCSTVDPYTSFARAVLRRPAHLGPAAGGQGRPSSAASCRYGWSGCAPRPFTDTLVAKFALPVEGWRGNRR